MSRAIRAWIPFVIAALLIVGVPGALVVGILWYQRSGVMETALQPQVVRLGADPRAISVGVTWTEEGWCLGDFQARATETSSEVRVAMIHRQFTHGGACAGVGTTYNTAWADVTLNAPVGTRAVVRSSDGTQLPVLTQDERFLRRHPVAADVKQFGGLNDNPPLALKKETQIIDAAALENLATQLDSLPPFPTGTIYCPNDDGSYYLVELDYATGGSTSLKIDARGCTGVYVNGLKKPTAWALSGTVNIFLLLNSLLGE
ncbi:MAG: hypothetical protein WCC30_14030 [Candidatus Dormiibacterota bacterium]